MPTVHVVSFMPLDYRIRVPLHFAAAFAATGYRVRTIELDGFTNRLRRFADHGMERLLLPFGRERMPAPLRALRRVMRYVYFVFLAALLRSRYRPGDIVVANDGWSLFLASLAVPLEKAIYYEVEIPNHLNSRTPLFERYLRGFLLRNVLRCAFLVSVERNRLRFLSKLFRNLRTALVMNAVPRNEMIPRETGVPSGGKPRILYAGRLWRFTLTPLFLEFVRKYHDFYRFEIFGEPDDDCRTAYEQIRPLPGVICHGFAPRAELERALNEADVSLVLWNPNDRANFGLRYCSPCKFFEAVAREIPVLCSPNPPLREWLCEYRVGELIEPLTVDGMHGALTRMLSPENYAEHRRECLRAFRENWNYDAQIAPFIERLRNAPEFAHPR